MLREGFAVLARRLADVDFSVMQLESYPHRFEREIGNVGAKLFRGGSNPKKAIALSSDALRRSQLGVLLPVNEAIAGEKAFFGRVALLWTTT